MDFFFFFNGLLERLLRNGSDQGMSGENAV